VLELADGTELRGDRLLVATGRRPRVAGLGLETVGLDGIEVDARMRVADGLWAIGDVTGIWPLTYVGKYQGRIAAANILGEPREADYSAVPRVVFTDPQAAAVGETEGPLTVTVSLAQVPRTRHIHARVRLQARLHDARVRREPASSARYAVGPTSRAGTSQTDGADKAWAAH
jgi:pyruvate/2-oxoglutarate dehydrogenase complex dihydrolipoamide dehydrogenase (E3) component